MISTRVIPVLLLKGQGLVKTQRFSSPQYLGDPLNAVRIFNEKEVDEIIFLDISATCEKRSPNFELVEAIASECFMPFCFGGGIRTLEDIRRVLALGAEKVALGSLWHESPGIVSEAARIFGNQSIVAVIDAKRSLFGKYQCYIRAGSCPTSMDPVAAAQRAVELGAGEIVIQSIDRDGSMQGYDGKLVRMVSEAVSVPVVACGGAGCVADLISVVKDYGASAAAAGSLFVFYGKHRAVLINFPSASELSALPGRASNQRNCSACPTTPR